MFKRISLEIRYARSYSVEAAIWEEDGILHYSNKTRFGIKWIEDEISDENISEFEKKLNRIGIDKWEKVYTPKGYDVLDGESWTVTYEDSDGKKITVIGENAYPSNWRTFRHIIESVAGNFNEE